MIWIVLIVLYALSVYGGYKYFQIAYSTGGRWSSIEPDDSNILLIFVPFIVIIFWLIASPYRNRESRAKKFFRIKE